MQNPKRDSKAGLSKAPQAVSQEFFRPRSGVYTRKNCEKHPFDLARRAREDLQRLELRPGNPENGKDWQTQRRGDHKPQS
jgi:hypothetical protein